LVSFPIIFNEIENKYFIQIESMLIEILTPEKKIFTGDAKLVKVPGTNGSFEVMDKHAPIISTLAEGQLKIITQDDQIKNFLVKGGVLEVKNNHVIILVDELT
jgi:F-type H+-transporting ATPase subunit epsilon